MPNRIIGFQKVLASVTMAATVLGLGSFAALPVAALAVAPADYGLTEGDVISANAAAGDPDVYIVNDWGYKRLFVNPAIFNLYGHLGWNKIKAVSAATRDAFITSGLFRNCESGDQKVYGIEVVSEDVANLHWVNISGADAVAQDPNFFKKVFCINNNEQALYGVGAAYTSLSQIPAYERGQTGQQQGPLSVSLAADNPASNTLIETQAAADLAHFTFTGNSSVTNVVLNRIGVSSDTTLTNVYLYQGSKRLTDAATVSSGKITFSDSAGLFTVAGSATISVKADVANSTSGQTIGVQLASYNGNAVSLSGNLFTVAVDPSDFGTLAVGVPTPTTANASLDPQLDYTMWQSTVTVGNHDAVLKSLQLRIIGSVATGDLRNFRLQVDGVQVGSAVAQVNMGTPDNGYIVFDFGSGVTLKAGSRVIKLLGDVIGGSTKTFSVSLRQKPDIYAVESQYGAGILPSGTFPAAAPTTGTHTINDGDLTITKMPDSPAGDVIDDATGVSLVKYKFEAFGESLKVENLRATFTAAGGDSATAITSLRNGAIFADGVQIGSIASLCSDQVSTTASCSAGTAYTEYNLGSSLVVVPGTPRIVEIRADIYDNIGTENTSANDTIAASFAVGNSNVQRLTSLTYFNSAAATAGNTLTIKTGSFTAAKDNSYANQSVVAPQSQYLLGKYTLTAASAEDINVNTVTVDFLDNGGGFDASDDLTSMFLKVYDDAGSLRYTSSPKSTVADDYSASNSYSVNFTIPKTKTWKVEVYANIGSTIGTGTLTSNLDAAGLTANSATTATAAQATGQVLTGATASLNLANGASPASAIVNGGITRTVYVFTLTPQYDNFTLDEATFKLSSTVASSSGAVGTLTLKDGANVIGSVPMTVLSSVAFDMTGLNYSLPQSGGTRTLTVEAALNNVGVGANDTAGLVVVQLSHLKYRDSNGNITTSAYTPASQQGNNNYVVKSFPTFSNVNLPSTVLAAGTQTLFKTQVSATGNNVVWRKVAFTITTTNGPTLTSFQLFENGSDISSLASGTTSANGTLAQYATNSKAFSTAAADSGTVVFVFNSDRTIPANGSVTLELKADVGGALSAGHSVTTKVANPNSSTFVAPEDVSTLGGSAPTTWRTDVNPSFLWSDSSAPSHASTTDDWMGDALLQGINASQALYQ